MGLLDGIQKLRETLSRTREGIAGKVARLVGARGTIDEETLEGLEEILLAADVGMDTATHAIDAIRKRVKDEGPAEASGLLALLKEEILRQFALRTAAEPPDPFALPAARRTGAMTTPSARTSKPSFCARARRPRPGSGASPVFTARFRSERVLVAPAFGRPLIQRPSRDGTCGFRSTPGPQIQEHSRRIGDATSTFHVHHSRHDPPLASFGRPGQPGENR